MKTRSLLCHASTAEPIFLFHLSTRISFTSIIYVRNTHYMYSMMGIDNCGTLTTIILDISETEHKIQYDIDFIVERTLNLQGLQAEQTQEAFVVVKTEPKEEAVEDIKSSPIVKPDIVKKSDDVIVKRTVPWFAGERQFCISSSIVRI